MRLYTEFLIDEIEVTKSDKNEEIKVIKNYK